MKEIVEDNKRLRRENANLQANVEELSEIGQREIECKCQLAVRVREQEARIRMLEDETELARENSELTRDLRRARERYDRALGRLHMHYSDVYEIVEKGEELEQFEFGAGVALNY